jgi:GT2 family glycosyltransferase
MISVVYCTREHNPKHTEHLKKMAGHPKVEVIEYINNGIPLTKAYNELLEKAKYDIVVFCHDDIEVETTQFAKKLKRHYDSSDYGILGVAGTKELHESGQWWANAGAMFGRVWHTHEGKKSLSKYSEDLGNNIEEVIVVDGVFFSVMKSRLKMKFDNNVNGFHFYDIDFCFHNYLEGVKVGVHTNIKINHMSIGMTNEQWEKNRQTFVSKFEADLPVRIQPTISYDEKTPKPKFSPKLTVIIPTKGNVDLLKGCINSIIEKTTYENIEVLIADTGSEVSEIKEVESYIDEVSNTLPIRLIKYDYYNFAKINNDVVNNHIDSETKLLLFCNNDIELINDAITTMVYQYTKNIGRVGTIGARLHFGDNKIQHAGICLYFRVSTKNLMLSHLGLKTSNYPKNQPDVKEVIGNTGAFLMVDKELFLDVGGFDEQFVECFEDVDLNLKMIERGRTNLFVNNAVCYHYESSTRKKDDNKLNKEREDLNQLMPKIQNNMFRYQKYIIPIR